MDCVSKSSCTPKKYIDAVGCITCGSEKADTRKRTKLNGKVSDLQQRICSILQVPSSSVNSNSYICNDRCYRDVNRLEKMQQDLKKLQNSLKEKFQTNKRAKRDSTIVLPPSKSSRQLTDPIREKARKSILFNETQPTSNYVFIRPVPTQLPLPTAPVSVQPQLSNENQSVVESAPCEGNICQVQVNKIIQ